MERFSSILVANRGEIACRVLDTANALGYRTVAIYSDADTDAPHVKLANMAIRIGGGPVRASYMVPELIINAAVDSGAQAIHPGYGFLSENGAFAKACEAAGLVFIGPHSEAIEIMGNKAESKRRMIEAGVPCIPGYEGVEQTADALLEAAGEIGFPIMVKAAAGGGGRGMRLVEDQQEFLRAIALAKAEAISAFGSDELILEKALVGSRHVEVQIFADNHGNTIHLGERDCSIQRRHQKIIEEAPCPIITDELRRQMGQSAVNAAKSVGYRGAGTVEFLLDCSGSFYFLEMNTRLQVEHPVTELITGLDLVAMQISAAQGELLSISQNDVEFRGHAIEARLYAEDPSQDFLPASGKVELWSPASGEGVRIDSGICSGQEISPFYDPMLAKVISCGSDRDTARKRLIDALKETVLFGISNNKKFLIDCLEKKSFIDGVATTAFIETEFQSDEIKDSGPSFNEASIAAVLQLELEYRKHHNKSIVVSPELKNWTNSGQLISRKRYSFGELHFDLLVSPTGTQDEYSVTQGDQSIRVRIQEMRLSSAIIVSQSNSFRVHFLTSSLGNIYVSIEGRSALYKDLILLEGDLADFRNVGRVIAPMHGLLLKVAVSVGDKVEKGQLLVVLEAMKMHYEILAEADGIISEIFVSAGDQVAADDVLIDIETDI